MWKGRHHRPEPSGTPQQWLTGLGRQGIEIPSQAGDSLFQDYFSVATKTSSSVRASVMTDSGESVLSCSMIFGPSPLAISSNSRPFFRKCKAPANLISGASDGK